MAVKHTKQKWVRENYNGNSWEQLIKTEDLTVLIAEVNTQHDVERHEAIKIAKAIEKVPEMIDVLQSLQILQEEKMLCHDMRITQDTMAKVESILKSLNDE